MGWLAGKVSRRLPVHHRLVLLFQDKDLIVPANGVADVEVRQTC